ncbi:MAG: radical SAM protein [Desulfovibrionaceae bacterium]
MICKSFARDFRSLLGGRVPAQVVIQYTDQCNAACRQCAMRAPNRFPRSTLDKEQTRRLIDALAQRGAAAVSFTGGEPLLHLDDVLDLMRHAGQAGVRHIRTGTNGFFLRGSDQPGFEARVHSIAQRLADTPVRNFWISLDSADPATHEKNRGLPGVVRGMEKALPIFEQYGIFPSANLGVNRLTGGPDPITGRRPDGAFDPELFREDFRRALSAFYAFVESLGFTMVNACYPMSFDEDEAGRAVYAASSVEDFIRFRNEEKPWLYQALLEAVPEFRSRLRVFTPRSALLELVRQYQGEAQGFACRGGIDFFFVDAANMDVFPCGYRGQENLGKLWDLDLAKMKADPWCKQCDWECFRDPSVLFGPVLELAGSPFKALRRLLKDREFARLWLEDLRYYRACGFFDARRPMDAAALSRFAPGAAPCASPVAGGEAPGPA